MAGKIVETWGDSVIGVTEDVGSRTEARTALMLNNLTVERLTIKALREEEMPSAVRRATIENLATNEVEEQARVTKGTMPLYAIPEKNELPPLRNQVWSFAEKPEEAWLRTTGWEWASLPGAIQGALQMSEKAVKCEIPVKTLS